VALDVIYALLVDDTAHHADMDGVRAVLDEVIRTPLDPEQAEEQAVEEWGTSPEAIEAANSDFWDADL
jgi:hypothetical protein